MNSPTTNRVLTVPNVISFVRLLGLLPLTMWLIIAGESGWALLSLATLAMSDWIDGFLARKLDQVSALGSQLDPVADRLSIVLISVALVIGGQLRWEIPAIIAVMDTICGFSMLFLLHSTSMVLVSRLGKVRTAVLLVGLPLLLVAEVVQIRMIAVFAVAIMWLGALLHVLAEIGYIKEMVKTRIELKAANKL